MPVVFVGWGVFIFGVSGVGWGVFLFVGRGVVCDGVDVRFEGVENKEIKNEMLFSGG